MSPKELASVIEVAEILGVSRTTATRYVDRPDFPQPVDELAVGRVWRITDVKAWARQHLPLKPGRPTRPAD